MTATDELRRMLDERGVEYEAPHAGFTIVRIDKLVCKYYETLEEPERGVFAVVTTDYLTPEQAIAATLGKEPDDTATLKLHDRMNAALLEYERALGNEKADGAITVPFVAKMHHLLEEAATLGADARPMQAKSSGTLTAEKVRELMGENSRQYPSPTDPYVWLTVYDWQAIADELNATLSRGTWSDFDMKMAYHMGYDDALARRKPDAGKVVDDG